MTVPKDSAVTPDGPGAATADAVSLFDAGIREAVPMPLGTGPGQRLGPDSLVWKFFG
ncbi:DUF2236 domain-containing protein, partial [Nocardia flavorosea]|nr:DUF2236 domain-containing protein [Nocardia flavorosea]